VTDRACAWPGCEDDGPTVSLDEGHYWFCLAVHATDDHLPKVFTGASADCHQCGRRTVTWIREPVLPLHADCVRAWAWVQVRGEAMGAYGRRARHAPS
jgi:hypothetical protein